MANDRDARAAEMASPDLYTPQRRGFLPPDMVSLMGQSMRFGAWTGFGGTMAGIGFGIAKDTSLPMTGAVNGITFFAGGTTYYFARTTMLRAIGDEANLKPIHMVGISTGAATLSGAAMGLCRSPGQIVPSMIAWGFIGAAGQMTHNHFTLRERKQTSEDSSWMNSDWSPLKKLSDPEYRDLMAEKKLILDADIEIIDERIAELRAAEKNTPRNGPRNDDKGG